MTSDARACSRCKGSNRPEARFCDGCGTPLALSCAGCGSELRAKARFCDGCGAPVARAAVDPRPVREYTPRHLVYAFKHPLTQEVALGSQLGERRKKLHAAAARALEDALAARLDESAALLAHHWEEAGRARDLDEALRLYRAMGAEGHVARLDGARSAP